MAHVFLDDVTLPRDPQSDLQAAPRQYIDNHPWTFAGGVTFLTAATDLNNVTATGFYNVQNPTNGPGTGWWVVEVLRYSTDASLILQRATSLDGASIYPQMRKYQSAAWNAWVEAGVVATADEGIVVTPRRTTLNFTGSGVTVADDAANNRTNITVPGGLDQATADTRYVNATGDTVNGNLRVVGNHQVDDAATPARSYRFRTSGSALDLEASGAQVYISNWSGAGFTGTQYFKMLWENGADITQAFGTWQWRTGPNGTTNLSIDANTGIIAMADGSQIKNVSGPATLTVDGSTYSGAYYKVGGNVRYFMGADNTAWKLSPFTDAGSEDSAKAMTFYRSSGDLYLGGL